jgi:hypothetical protein
MTGDNRRSAEAVAHNLGIECVFAEERPEQKVDEQHEQQTKGKPTMAAHPTGVALRAAHRRMLRPSHSRRYAIVPDRAAQAQYIWDPDTDTWYGPFATRWDAELTLVRWRAERQHGEQQ